MTFGEVTETVEFGHVVEGEEERPSGAQYQKANEFRACR